MTSQTADERTAEVQKLISALGSEPGAAENCCEELRRIAELPHTLDCALGAVPACTCGVREAKRAVNLHHLPKKGEG